MNAKQTLPPVERLPPKAEEVVDEVQGELSRTGVTREAREMSDEMVATGGLEPPTPAL